MENSRLKIVNSPGYNYIFRKSDGYFMRWGKHYDDDPDFSPLGPEIADIEISTICGQGCRFCYKKNTKDGKNMSFSQFVNVFHKLPRNLTQIAFGIGDVDTNPDLFDILHYTRQHGVVPNITINGNVSDNHLNELVMVCGAIAVSNYGRDKTLQQVVTLDYLRKKNGPKSPLKQINIHQLLAEETYSACLNLMESPLPTALNAIVFLSLKPKGRAVGQYHQLKDMRKFQVLVNYALTHNIPIGFDSCTCNSFLRAIQGYENEKSLAECADPCESTCFSIYIDVDGYCMPCSFSSELDVPSIHMATVDDFLKDVWFHKDMIKWRNGLIKNCRSCPLYDLEIR